MDMGDTNFVFIDLPLKKKSPKGNKHSQNSPSSFWIQYKDEEKSHDIASHQLALLKLCTSLTECNRRNRLGVGLSCIWAPSSLSR